MNQNVVVQYLGLKAYEPIVARMQKFTKDRDEQTIDELWCVEHPQVFTQGRHGKDEHIINLQGLPLVHSDRGGQITFHAQGQAIIYFMLDIRRKKIGLKTFVANIELAAMAMLQKFNIDAHLVNGAPGIYVANKKICSLGLRVKQGKTYHGISINTDMNLKPFSYIDPCGYKGLQVCQLQDFNKNISIQDVWQVFCQNFCQVMSFKTKELIYD